MKNKGDKEKCADSGVKSRFLVTFGTTIGTYRYDFPSLDRFNDWLYISGKPGPSYREAYVLCGSSTCPCDPLDTKCKSQNMQKPSLILLS